MIPCARSESAIEASQDPSRIFGYFLCGQAISERGNAQFARAHQMKVAPRPWSLSITAKWHDAKNFDQLEKQLHKLKIDHPLPYYHLPIPHESQHSTLLAVAEICEFPTGKSAADHAEDIFSDFLLADPKLEKKLNKAFKPFTVQPARLKCYDDNTTIEFGENEEVKKLRDALRRILLDVFTAVARDRKGILSLLQDENKSRGKKFFGSIARSAHPSDLTQLRWVEPLPDAPALNFEEVHFLVSDEGLTNVHKEKVNSLRLPSKK